MIEAQVQLDSASWWRGAVLYQIYPRSFLDTNGDGIGDLPGITARLDYIASLGVDGIWISPFFLSPMKDFGYDVANYLEVDPMFGTLDDFRELLDEAHRRGLRVVIDQVYSHTSDQHDWFTESRSDRSNAKADWYVWADPKEDGSPPTNWLSVFGGPAWSWDGRRKQYYLHNFLSSQPDLNLHNPDVQAALIDVARFWLDLGVDGFRLDAINFGMHDLELRDNPPAPRDGRTFPTPYSMQSDLRTLSHPSMLQFLNRYREALSDYEDVFTVAEIGGENPTPTMQAYTEQGLRLDSAYGFEFLGLHEMTPENVAGTLGRWPGEPGEGWPSWAFSNHDGARVLSRWSIDGNTTVTDAKLFALLQMSLRGNVFLYQGEELGLPQSDVPFERLQDPEAINNWPETQGRDGARTPMPWAAGEAFFGFSTVEPWLPAEPTHGPLSIDVQESDPDSVLNFYRKLISTRREVPALIDGGIEFVEVGEQVLIFRRKAPGSTVICIFNFGAREAELDSSVANLDRVLIRSYDAAVATSTGSLPPRSGFIALES